MDDGTLLLFITTLFAMNYGGTWLVYQRITKVSAIIKILCREHSKNHGQTEIDL
jgi:hypothetical protein